MGGYMVLEWNLPYVIGGRPYYRGSSSSSNGWIQSQEFDELRKDLERVKKERDELQVKIVNIEKLFEKNNTMIRGLMDSINCLSMPPSFEKTEDEDETQPPSQSLGSHQGNFIILYIFYLKI